MLVTKALRNYEKYVDTLCQMAPSIPEVALISGHKDLRVLSRYTHLKAERIVKRLAKF